MITPAQPNHELRFLSLFDPNRDTDFPVMAQERSTHVHYVHVRIPTNLRAKVSIGREFAPPSVTCRDID